MSYSHKLFTRKIMTQIGLLLCLLLASYAGLMFGDNFFQQRQNDLHLLVKNEQSKLALANILQQNLLAVKVQLHEMSNAVSTAEMSHVSNILQGLQTEILKILEVIESGGEKKITYFDNFGNKEVLSQQFNDSNFARQFIDFEIIDFRAKLVELDGIVANLINVVEDKVAIMNNRDPLDMVLIDRKVSNYFQGIEPFFLKILENSYRLNFTSNNEAERIQKISDKFSQTYFRVKNTITACIAAFVLLMGWVVLRSNKKIFLESQNYQQNLQKINEDLERIVHKRTSALTKEVSDRKNAELQVKKDADFLHNIIESLAHSFYVIDVADYSIVLANSAAMENCKEPCTTYYALTSHRDKPCDGSDHPCPLQLVKETLSPVVVERIDRNSQGDEIFFEIHGHPVFDDNGNLIQVIEYSLDITDKKRVENALKKINEKLEEKVKIRTSELEEQILHRKTAELTQQKREKYFRRLIESVSDVITILDEEGTITYSSPSAEKLMGRKVEEIIGQNIRSLVFAEDLKHVEIATLYKHYSGTIPMEYRVRDESGQVHVLESFIQQFQQDDNSNCYILYSRDITTRKKFEEETHKLKMVVEQSPSSVVITDIAGAIEYVNPAFERITGYRYSEVIGKNPRVLKSGLTPEDVFLTLWKTITAGRIWRGEFINKKKNGEHYNENVLIVPIKKRNGEITNFVAVKENVTELKRARKRAEQANQAKSNFLSHMSHELRTPLNAINGFSQLMLKSKKNPLNEKQGAMVAQIHTAGQHLLQLINEVLDLARIESGEFSLSIEPLDPHAVLHDCLSLTNTLVREKSITIISLYEDSKFPSVRADLTRMKQVLLNLLSNAIKYNKPQGTVTIDIETDVPGFLRFVVTDTGIGIPEEKQKDLFIPFVRAVENPDAIEGTGIGMTISKQLVEKMGGDIGFESQQDQGSRFWFTLPVSAATPMPELSVDSAKNSNCIIGSGESIQSKLVLYVEDNPINVTFMREFFSELENLRLIIASTGEEGVSMALKNIPDLILMDLNLPGINGFQAYRQIKANPKTEFIPVVVVSADAMEKTVKRIHKMGFDGYVPKPVDVDQLLKTMTEILKD